MLKKRAVVQTTAELNSMLTNIEISEGDVLFRSDQYIQLGCDLRDIGSLGRVLGSVVDIEKCKLHPLCSHNCSQGPAHYHPRVYVQCIIVYLRLCSMMAYFKPASRRLDHSC